MDEVIRIVLAEDHELLREGTRHMLARYADMSIVGEAGDGLAAWRLIASMQPDVAILDLRMPKLSAIEILRKNRAGGSATKCLILSAYDDNDFVLSALEEGAKGYLLKTVRTRELVDAVRAVHRGETVLQPVINRRLASMWGRQRDHSRKPCLTERELEVLTWVCRGMRNKEIAAELEVSSRTVEGHVSTILSKLGVESRTEAAVSAFAHGLVTPQEAESQQGST